MDHIKKKIRKEQNRTFLARDFESIRSQLLDTARTYFPDKIQDFSEPSVGGMMLDFVATVGDSLSFYLDHSFRELDPFRATETENIVAHLRNAGVKIVGRSPASVTLEFQITVPSEVVSGVYLPKLSALPVLLAGTTVSSFSGITYVTIDDLDFAAKDVDGNFAANFIIATTNADGSPATFYMSNDMIAVSGEEKTEEIDISSTFTPFREVTLDEKYVSAVLSVTDTDSNTYYEVSSLSEDTVFLKTKNPDVDNAKVPYHLKLIAAPYRYIRKYDPVTQLTTLRFGSGNAETLDDDIVPDPSDLSLSLFGKSTMTRFSIDPQSLLQTQTLGISPNNTTLSIRYRYGGGLDHNVSANQIQQNDTLSLEFRRNPTPSDSLTVRQTIQVTNPESAAGGAPAASLDDLKTLITSARKAQNRVVSREDLLSRIYTIPSEFGRVFRAAVADNPANPMAALLYVISLDENGDLTTSPDSLKKNLKVYLNDLRLIGDAIDILDARVINFGVKYSVYVHEGANKAQVIQDINTRISSVMNKKYFNINQPLVVDDVTNIIINTNFVISLIDLQIFPRIGVVAGREYNTSTFDFKQSQTKGLIQPDSGSIFEIKHPDFDIIGSAH